jgi:hypothetical protein
MGETREEAPAATRVSSYFLEERIATIPLVKTKNFKIPLLDYPQWEYHR